MITLRPMLLLSLLSFVLLTHAAQFQPSAAAASSIWGTNGPVNAAVLVNDTLYIGGRFTAVGPASSRMVALDAGSGAPDPEFPWFDGQVSAIAPDGAGGWFVGGSFSHVNDIARAGLVHLFSDMSIDPQWNPGTDGYVQTIAVLGQMVYISGDFNSVAGEARPRLAALDAVSGALTPWASNTKLNGLIYAMTASGSTVYIGGDFGSRVAALDATTGDIRSWNAFANNTVLALLVHDNTLYIGGIFANASGLARPGVAALDATTGMVTNWNPGVNPGGWVFSLAVSGNTVYIGGWFSQVGGQPRKNLAAIDRTTGLPTAWQSDTDDGVFALATDDARVYAGGEFTSVGGQARNRIAAIDAISGETLTWNPNLTDGRVQAITLQGNTVYAGGSFSIIGGQRHDNLAAIDLTTGRAADWRADVSYLNDDPVQALAVDGANLYVGGTFQAINGQPRTSLGAVDLATGAPTPWSPAIADPILSAPMIVRALAIGDGIVYFGGRFSSVGGQARNNIAAVDAATGAVTAWHPQSEGEVGDMLRRGDTLYVTGIWAIPSGGPYSLVALDATTADFEPWKPVVYSICPSCERAAPLGINSIALGDTVLYIGGIFTNVDTQKRHGLAAIDLTSGLATSWNPTPNESDIWADRATAIARDDGLVYLGGAFSRIGGFPRVLAAVDAQTGAPTNWGATLSCVDNGFMASYPACLSISAMVVHQNKVYVAGSFGEVNGKPQNNLAAISTDTLYPVHRAWLPLSMKAR